MQEMTARPEGGLLQTDDWANFQRKEGKKVVDITVGNDRFFGVEHLLPVVGSYMYYPRMDRIDRDILDAMKEKRASWIRVDVANEETVEWLIKNENLVVKAPHDMQPRENLIVDIGRGEEELLSAMKGKTRYNIRLAEKKGVEIIRSKSPAYVDSFCRLVSETALRKGVSFHKSAHYKKMLTVLPDEKIDLYVALYKKEVIAANLVTYCSNTATYLHGATSDVHRNVMAPFLLQWKAVIGAKEKGCTHYDLGGMYPQTNDPGKQGVTRFKKGFAPKTKLSVGAGSYDIVLSPAMYRLYRVLQKLR